MKSSKVIDISQASLVSLKAELSRKHEEVNKAKTEAQASFIHPVPRQKKIQEKPKKVVEEKDAESIREDEELHRQSRNKLEAKAKLYDQLANASTSQEDENSVYLVNFEQKSAESKSEEKSQEDKAKSQNNSEDEFSDHESDDEWMDYTDCLGRTRRCLKCDLDFVKEKDEQLAKSLGFFVDEKGGGESVAQKTLVPDPTSNDLRLEQLRQKWEQQEELLKDKKDIHYQDVLFDEARTHGVGYFAFAQDEDLRKKQQEALTKLRDDTRRQQDAAKETRRRREAALKARVRAARNRQRARMGLPPEPEETQDDKDSNKQREEEEAKKAAQMEADRIAKQEEELRKLQTLRPWDVGKDRKKPFEEMSQEDWVKKKRGERNNDFAPPNLYYNDERRKQNSLPSNVFDSKGHVSEIGPMPLSSESNFSSVDRNIKPSEAGSSVITISDDVIIDLSKPPPAMSSKFNRVRYSAEDIKNKVKSKFQKIVNEVKNPIESSSEEEIEENTRGKGVEIEPPASCEYYGLPPIPVPSKGQKESNMSEIEKSISVGLKFLRKQQEAKNEKMEKSDLEYL